MAFRRDFFNQICSLQNFRVRVLTEGDVGFVEGIMTNVNDDFITICGAEVFYIPIEQITIITRAEFATGIVR
ncbi:MAG: hypothetical protein ACM3QZ_02865 [Solirubrobacterales bacterium]